MPFIAEWEAFGVTPAVREKLMAISPRTRFRGGDHRPRPQKRQGRPRPQGQKSQTATDVASGWIRLYSPLNKAHRWTFNALKDIHATLPFPLREFHSDNGSEFINQAIVDWRRNPLRPIPFTRSRDHKKNDNCFVERKNGAVVREYIGYDRMEGEALHARLAEAHRSLAPSSISSRPP